MSGKLARCLWYSANMSMMGPHPAWAAQWELTNGFLGISGESTGGPGPPSPARPGWGAQIAFTHEAEKRPGSLRVWSPQASPQCPASCTSSASGASTAWLHPGPSSWSHSAPGCAAAWPWCLHVLPPAPGAQSLAIAWGAHCGARSRVLGEESPKGDAHYSAPAHQRCSLHSSACVFWFLMRIVLEYGSTLFQEPKYSDIQAE